MVKRMLIDATHPEETRVAVVSGNKLEEYDYETSTKKQLKGNIYLAKITRVEPSLQAAFVDYGGNRHGFLAFNEIHPDYYRIPIADREALIAEEAEVGKDDDGGDGADAAGEEDVEVLDGDDDGIAPPRRRPMRRYKIQEVISKRQIVLVQVVKEERGTKGAALTTYISLPGRYCVLMPNTPRGGGISRKITNAQDRKRLKGLLEELSIPDGMAVILRTAGMERSKAEIKRDYEYLIKLWDEIRELTLKSTAPALIYEEADLIRRAIRDLYTRDIKEVFVEGDEGYRTAKDFMKRIVPSHAKRVQPYKDGGIPMFHRYQVESQIDSIQSPVVQLKSGGYIVMNPTEALVAIDVNSGRSTRERNIEETALRTNLEAAEEVARQLRLRDLAGLIVIDFIDMDDHRNQAQVERRFKEAMKHDRARIQIGRISAFGLLELSRQRLRPSLLEASAELCPRCGGTGYVRSTEATALNLLRMAEEEGMRRRSREITISVPTEVAIYALNQKRAMLAEIEQRYGFKVIIAADDTVIPPELPIERVAATGEGGAEEAAERPEAKDKEKDKEEAQAEESRPRRGRRGGRRRDKAAEAQPEDKDAEETAEEPQEARAGEGETERSAKRPRRRGRRGGRRRTRRPSDEGTGDAEAPAEQKAAQAADAEAADTDGEAAGAETATEAPKPRKRRSPAKSKARPKGKDSGKAAKSAKPAKASGDDAAKPAAAAAQGGNGAEPSEPAPAAQPEDRGETAAQQARGSEEDETGPRRRGWWNRLVSPEPQD